MKFKIIKTPNGLRIRKVEPKKKKQKSFDQRMRELRKANKTKTV